MPKLTRVGKGLFIASLLAAVVLAVMTAPAVARINPGKCECANLDAPVICKGGKIYPNPCAANCFGATGCVPYPG